MFTITHFRSEFIHQGQATILRKVTMTQFMFVILTVGIAVGILGAPWWLAPIFMALGYIAGANYHGDLLIRRLVTYLHVRGREATGVPRIINVDADWEAFADKSSRSASY